MPLRLLLLFLLTLPRLALAQAPPTREEARAAAVCQEGYRLYRVMRLGIGTELFRQQKPKLAARARGYITYWIGSRSGCMLYDGATPPRIVGGVVRDSARPDLGTTLDTVPRAATPFEAELIAMRLAALAHLKGDTAFHDYANASVRVIPLIDGAERRVYVLSYSKKPAFVLYGNDLVLRLDSANRVLEAKPQHRRLDAADAQAGPGAVAFHYHGPADSAFVTATDIATTLLCRPGTNWERLTTLSPTWASVWNCDQQSLRLIPRPTYDAILKDARHQRALKDSARVKNK